MTPKQRNAAIFGTIAVGTLVYLYYRSEQNKKEGSALLDYINKSYSQVDISSGGDQAIKETKDLKLDWKNLKIDNLKGPISNPAITKAFANTIAELHDSMKGVGTNTPQFFKNFYRIKSKNTMASINQYFKDTYKQDLFSWMKEESALNSADYGAYSDKTNGPLQLIPGINSYWHPNIAKYLQILPAY
jgi:hypothetical protein